MAKRSSFYAGEVEETLPDLSYRPSFLFYPIDLSGLFRIISKKPSNLV